MATVSKVLKVVGTVAAGVAILATAGAALGPALGLKAATIGTLSKVATIASVVSAVANVGAQLTAPKPVARGSPTQVLIASEPPRPFCVGRIMTAGVMRHQVAYGPTIKKVPNPYLWQVRVLSGVGPIQGIVSHNFDFEPVSSFYNGFVNFVQQLGQRPESSALVPPISSPAPGWTSSSRLSGCAAVGINARFDPDGQRFAAGFPIYTALVDGEKVYDPRQDSTFPGGSGPCRLGVESTYVYNPTPALYAATYAYGYFQNGVKVFGLGLSADAIDWTAVVDWANDCEANDWTCGGVLYEGGTGTDVQAQRVRNLDDLCAAGGGRWITAGGMLSFDWHRPRVSLATITDDDLLEAGGAADGCQSIRDRMNGVRPQYIEPDNNWEQVTADEIIGTTYRTEDGQPLVQTYPLNLVTDKVQAGQLAAYFMADSREIGPIDLNVKVDWRFYRPGDTITIDSELLNYSGQAVINQRSLNPSDLSVTLSLKSETPGKHTFALGKEAVPPPSPVLGQSPEERDAVAGRLANAQILFVTFTTNPGAFVPGDGQVDIAAHDVILSDTRTINLPARLETGLAQLTRYRIFWDLVNEDYVFEDAALPSELESVQFVRIASIQTSDGVDFPPPPPPPPPGFGVDPNIMLQ